MCGIAGYILTKGAIDNGGRLKAMADSIQHRGPDGDGYFATTAGAAVGLAHRRLAIIDIAGGDQPMVHPGTGAVLVYNGEIYNFDVLRQELTRLGHQFRTRSDTEVLLNAYAAWGADCVTRLRGMFSFALWDPAHQRLVLARDQFGKKPLYVFQDEHRLLFGSEIKALLAFGDVPKILDVDSVAEFLSFKYVPAPHTLFAGIRKLMPGGYAIWEAGKFTEKSYYLPPYGETPPARRLTGAELERQFALVLDEAVRIRMVSDVPYGAFLSGGLDSAALVALMTRHTSEQVNTFSVGFREERYSELPHAEIVAQKFQTRHHALIVGAEDLIGYLPKLIHHSDGPVGEASNIPIYLLSREAAKSVKMVLTGEGSDELLGGYPRHQAERFVGPYQTLIPQTVHAKMVRPAIEALPSRFWRLRPLAAAFGERQFAGRMQAWLGGLTAEESQALLPQHRTHRAADPRPFHPDPARSALEKILYFEQTSWLPDNLLERGDRLTMAASIEGRMPFMDTRLTALMATASDRVRIKGFNRKYALRRMMRGTLPDQIIDRPKVGFRVPIADWFRGSMRTFVRDTLMAPGTLAQDFFQRSPIERMLKEHDERTRNHEKPIWMLLNLQLFQNEFALSMP